MGRAHEALATVLVSCSVAQRMNPYLSQSWLSARLQRLAERDAVNQKAVAVAWVCVCVFACQLWFPRSWSAHGSMRKQISAVLRTCCSLVFPRAMVQQRHRQVCVEKS